VNRLLDYLPPVLQNIRELGTICKACTKPLERAWEDADALLDDQFIQTAAEASVAVWEAEYGIIPGATDTLETRKARLRSVWTKSVYTMRWLSEWVQANCTDAVAAPSVSDYALTVTMPVGADCLSLIRALYRRIPANILLCPVFLDRSRQNYYHRIYPRAYMTFTIRTQAVDLPVDTPTDNSGHIVSDDNGDIIISGGNQ